MIGIGIGISATLWLATEPGTVIGRITEQGEPLDEPYVSAYCPGLHDGEVDPETGRFEMSLPAGECRIHVITNTGKRSVTVEVPEGETIEIDIELVPREHPKSTSWSLLGLSLERDLQWPQQETVGIAGLNLNLGSSRRLRVYGFDLGVVSRIEDRGVGVQAGVSVRACGWDGLQFGVVAQTFEPEGEDEPECMFGVDGVQIALAYAKVDLVFGLQFAGIMAEDFNLSGVQLSGVFGRSHGALGGVQVAGVVAWAEWPRGLQIGGGGSVANYKLDGVQIAGVANVVVEEAANGLQISPVINYAPCLRGVQIGLINIALDAAGVQLGLINVIGRRVIPVLNVGADRCDV